MIKIVRFLLLVLFLSLHLNQPCGCAGAINGENFVAAIQQPAIPQRQFSIRDFGAIGDGHTLCTDAIQKTIAACAAAGGGRVVIPSGIWLTGPIRLESRIELHLESGSLLLFSSDHQLYPVVRAPTKGWLVASPIYGYGLEDVAITGNGIIDGAGESWRPVKKFKTFSRQWKELISSGGVVDEEGDMWWPSREAMEGEAFLHSLRRSKPKKEHTAEDYLPARDYLRPYMISFIDCKRILFEGVTIKNSPKFALCPAWCEQLIIRNVKVNNEWWAQNGDGIDISACRNVLVEECTVAAGDDGICLKSSSRSGRTGPALENVLIRDCIVYHGHGGFVVGSNTDGGMRNIRVDNCTFIGTDVGLRFKSARGSGGVVESISIRNIRMKDIVGEAICFDALYESDQPDAREIPVFRDITIDSLYCAGAARAMVMTGLPEMPIRNIRIRDAYISAAAGVRLQDVRDLSLERVVIKPAQDALYDFKRCSGITIDGAGYSEKSAAFPSNTWRSLMNHDEFWFSTAEASAIAENLLLYQCAIGGWPKNIDMARPLSPAEKAGLAVSPADTLATIDNGATWTQLAFLARVISAHAEPRLLEALNRGLDYLFAAQYDNGGWPQFYPLHPGYFSHITYNDDAMIGVLTLLQDIAEEKTGFGVVDPERRARAAAAVQRGVRCILATQLKEGEKRTAWCAQYDERNLQPAPARTYELVSLSGDESVGIVRFLMSLPEPSPEIIAAVQGAAEWFEKVKIKGIRVDYVTDPSLPGGFNKVVVADPAAPPVWARFYAIGSNQPFFSDRDGKMYTDLAAISAERRNEYAWLGYWPHELLETEYPAWLNRPDVRLQLTKTQ